MDDSHKALRVLIVDNQRSVRHSLHAGLESLSLDQEYEIHEATSGEEALLAFARKPLVIDLLVSGLHLAGMSGVELARKLRIGSPEMRVILLANNIDDKIRRQALEAKADALIAKPVSLSEFGDAVSRCFGWVEAAPEPAATQAISAEKLRERLDTTCLEMGALAVLVLNQSSEIVAQAGSPHPVQIDSLVPVIQEALSASARLSQALGGAQPDDLLCFTGPDVDLFASHLSGAYALLVVFDRGVMGITRARAARLVSTAAQELATIMPVVGDTKPLKREVSEVVETPAAPEPVTGAEGVSDLEAIFSQAEERDLDTGELNEYWEAALDGQDNGGANDPDAVSFDQAQQMGIVDEESKKT